MDNSNTRTKRLKHKLFLFGSEQLKSMLIHELVFVVMKIIELFQLQILAFAVYQKLFPNSQGADFLHTVSEFFMWSVAGKETRRVAAIIIILAMFLLQVFVISQMSGHLTRFRPSYFLAGLIKASAIYAVLFKFILLTPFQYTLMEIYMCDGFSQCLSSTHIIWLVLGVTAQIGLIFTLLLAVYFAREDRSESHLPWACYSGIVHPLRYLLPITVSVLLSFGVTWDILHQLPVIVGLLSLTIIIMRWKQGGERRMWANSISAFQEILTFSVHMAIFFIYLADQAENVFYAAMALSPSLLFTFELARQWREERIVKTTLPAQQQNINDIKIYINRLLQYILNPANSENYMKMTSILTLHSESCENPECVCEALQKFTMHKYSSRQSASESWLRQDSTAVLVGAFIENYNQVKDKWAKFFILLIQEALGKFQRTPAMHLQLSYLYLRLFKNCYMALYSAQSANVWRPSITLQFDIFHHMRYIETVLSRKVDKRSVNKRHIVNIERSIEYMVQLNIFQEAAEACSTEHQQFWTVLLEAEPDTTKLFHYGAKITQGINDIRKVYKNIMEITQNNVSFLYKYALFLKNVIHDDIEAHSIITKILNSRDISVGNERKWNSWEGQSGLIRASGDRKSLAQIRDVSLECEQLLGYSKKELIGISCNKLMPSLVARCHDEWILRFYETMQAKIINTPFVTFALKKNRYYFQCEILTCVIPNLDSGIQEFAVFIKAHSKSSHTPAYLSRNDCALAIFLCDKNLNIIGINEACNNYFGIPFEVADPGKYECRISDLFPEFGDCENPNLNTDGITLSVSSAKIRQRLPGEVLEEQSFDESSGKLFDFQEDSIPFWGKMVEETYGEKSGLISKLRVCFLLPLEQKEELLKAAPTITTKGKKEVKKDEDLNKPEDTCSMYDSSYASSNTSSTTVNSEARSIKEFKLKLYERKYPFAVTLLKRCMLVLAAILFIIGSNFLLYISQNNIVCDYILAKIEADGLVTSFELLSDSDHQYHALMMTAFEIRRVFDVLEYLLWFS